MGVKCFECGAAAEANHHVVPRSLGGTKTVPLCLPCHSKVHGKDLVKMKRLSMEGLKRAKAAGKKLGNPKNLTDSARRKGSEAMRTKAKEAYKHIIPLMVRMRENSTLQQIADHLNEQGELTTRGKAWSSVAVMRVLDRISE